MAIDRFVRFNTTTKPSRYKLILLLEDYIKGLGDVCEYKNGRIYAKLLGSPTDPFARIESVRSHKERSSERWIEVLVQENADTVNVITRHHDAVTKAIAEGFADLCAQYWCGKRDPTDFNNW